MRDTPSLLSTEDSQTLSKIAAKLEDPTISPEQRVELLHAIESIADAYACDPRLAD
jgi:hypothetical protein